ncbi:peptidylprolyl isomerase [Campylobacter mucosalis]|uniref:SurA-like chaperone / peptidyl-prolyl cis-trans isomerase n=1 Tax=Campylobacter mucosalis CCUG 21559 TaxID=1032067 RepID=A0A6G5QH53_9BACT|nr:peptidyl-prolyl cis-trans isomerase [Campylobacter mucosalis]QCD44962.1 SurA-like chaperone / peptidyl-prolyl cis-trans isomerase [Campylobacter mucosalis CCUG 21559]
MKKTLLSSLLALSLASSLNAAVVATVNGEAINDTDIDAILAMTAPGATYAQIPADAKKRLIDNLIDRKLVLKEAKSSGIESESDFKKALENMKNNIATDLYMKKIFDKQKVSDDEAKKAYNDHKQLFEQPASSRARHILVESEAEAKNIIAELKKLSGDAQLKKFAELAQSKSIDKGSAAQGGELGWFESSKMVKPFADAVNTMKKGEISKAPVKSNFGYHVILKEDFKAAGTVPFEQVKQQVIEELKMEKFQKELKSKMDELRSKAKIEYK